MCTGLDFEGNRCIYSLFKNAAVFPLQMQLVIFGRGSIRFYECTYVLICKYPYWDEITATITHLKHSGVYSQYLFMYLFEWNAVFSGIFNAGMTY